MVDLSIRSVKITNKDKKFIVIQAEKLKEIILRISGITKNYSISYLGEIY